jgi:hypothetical protein
MTTSTRSETMMNYTDRCGNENERGECCTLGPKHRVACRFGKSYVPSEPQWALLEEIAGFNTRKFQCIGTSTVASLKALNSRGFIFLRYVNSRAWDATILPAGRRLLQDRPR